MAIDSKQIEHFILWTAIFLLIAMPFPTQAEAPTLARLSFRVAPERMANFESAYTSRVVPLLKKHGLVESSEKGRATSDSVFSRLFEVETPVQVDAKGKELEEDLDWQEVLRNLGEAFGSRENSVGLRWEIYRTPAGSGETIEAGPGFRHGLWQTFDSRDGLLAGGGGGILQDRAGNLWFARAGITRYDGETFTTFTTENGLVEDAVLSIMEDRAGNLWLGTEKGGVSRYDGAIFETFSTVDGLVENGVKCLAQDRAGNLWFGTDQGASRFDGAKFETFTVADGLVNDRVNAILMDQEGAVWFGTGGREEESGGVSRYDGESFVSFTTEDGLALDVVSSIWEDREGDLWFATLGGGVSRYDGQAFFNLTEEDGLGYPSVSAMLQDGDGDFWFAQFADGVSRYDGEKFERFTIAEGMGNSQAFSMAEDRDGHLWFGLIGGSMSRYDGRLLSHFTQEEGLIVSFTFDILEDRAGNLWFTSFGGVSRYDGEEFTRITTADGLASGVVYCMLEDREGNLWFGTNHGVSRFDGEIFTSFTARDGLVADPVVCMMEDRQGHLWFGTGWFNGGVTRYDGSAFTPFTTEDGLAGNHVRAMIEDREGHLWFGTGHGVSRYDGTGFVTFAAKDGLTDNRVAAILEDGQGHLWFGTEEGIFRYDGDRFVHFLIGDGPEPSNIFQIFEDRVGHLWFGDWGSGVIHFDGRVFQFLDRRDGLVDNSIQDILQDREGNIWIGSEGGAVRYRPSRTPPRVRIKQVIADRTYESVESVDLLSTQQFAIFEVQGRSLTSRPDQMVYLFRLEGYEEEWRQTRDNKIEYAVLPVGEYTFQVQAVDRDLNYSEIAEVRVRVSPPYGQLALGGGLLIALIGLVGAAGYAVQRRRERDRAREELVRELEEELQTAHDMQMGLMPKDAPEICGFDVAGRCIPANHVGGDFFQYFQQDGTLAICMADVTGHAMEAAIPVVMFSGILENQMEAGEVLEALFARLNHSLHRILDGRTFVCFTMAKLDPTSRSLRLANGGCPYPYHYRSATGEVAELQVDAYPLGVRDETHYPVIEVQLEPGDRVIFCSDGIIEAENIHGELFGFERAEEIIGRSCGERLSPVALIDRVIEEVKAFSGDALQSDDQTIVVLAAED